MCLEPYIAPMKKNIPYGNKAWQWTIPLHLQYRCFSFFSPLKPPFISFDYPFIVGFLMATFDDGSWALTPLAGHETPEVRGDRRGRRIGPGVW